MSTKTKKNKEENLTKNERIAKYGGYRYVVTESMTPSVPKGTILVDDKYHGKEHTWPLVEIRKDGEVEDHHFTAKFIGLREPEKKETHKIRKTQDRQ